MRRCRAATARGRPGAAALGGAGAALRRGRPVLASPGELPPGAARSAGRGMRGRAPRAQLRRRGQRPPRGSGGRGPHTWWRPWDPDRAGAEVRTAPGAGGGLAGPLRPRRSGKARLGRWKPLRPGSPRGHGPQPIWPCLMEPGIGGREDVTAAGLPQVIRIRAISLGTAGEGVLGNGI